MMNAWDVIDPKNFIMIETFPSLSEREQASLTQLYGPIIGSDALYLYLSLFFWDRKNQRKAYMLSRLLNYLSFSLERFFEARTHLEGIGLLSVYAIDGEKDSYLYRLERPLDSSKFLSDSILVGLLAQYLGGETVKEILDKETDEKVKISSNLSNITQSFNDVFQLEHTVDNDALMQAVAQQDAPSVTTKTSQVMDKAADTFDFEFLEQSLDQSHLQSRPLTEDVKEIIASYHLMYHLTEIEMRQLLLQSADIQTGKINPKTLHSEILSYIDRQQLSQTADKKNTDSKDDDQLKDLRKKAQAAHLSADEWQLVVIATQLSPMDFIQDIKRQKDGFVASHEKWTINHLIKDSPLSNSVINILIHYVLLEQSVMNQSYTETIANDWAQAQVKDPVDAMIRVRERYRQGQEKYQQSLQKRKNWQRKPRRQEKVPDWMATQGQTKEESTKNKDINQSESHQSLDELRQMRDQWSKWNK